MILNRFLLKELKVRADRPDAKPMLLKGARGTGKTALMRALGETVFAGHTAYFDLAKNRAAARIFEDDLDPRRLVQKLQALTHVPIREHKTLIMLDNLEASDRALASLKYFAQEARGFRVIAAATYLDAAVRMRHLFTPVGCVEILTVQPLSFAEFLANHSPSLFDEVEYISSFAPLTNAILTELFSVWQTYLTVGGLPEAAAAFLSAWDITAADHALTQYLLALRGDFSANAQGAETRRIGNVWQSLPQQLVAGASKFFLSKVDANARSREYRPAVFWLEEAGLITRIYRARKPALPLSAYCNFEAYKVSLFDTGLLRAAAGISADALQRPTPEAAAVRAVLDRNALTQSLAAQLKARPAYFETNGRTTADFLIQTSSNLIPAELALNPDRRGNTIKRFAVRQKMPFAVRFALDNLSFTDGVMTIPLPLADWTAKLIGLTENSAY